MWYVTILVRHFYCKRTALFLLPLFIFVWQYNRPIHSYCTCCTYQMKEDRGASVMGSDQAETLLQGAAMVRV